MLVNFLIPVSRPTDLARDINIRSNTTPADATEEHQKTNSSGSFGWVRNVRSCPSADLN